MPIAAAVMALVVEPMEKRVLVSTRRGLPQLLHAVALGEDDLAVLDHGDGEPDRSPVLEGLRGVGVEGRGRVLLLGLDGCGDEGREIARIQEHGREQSKRVDVPNGSGQASRHVAGGVQELDARGAE